MTAKTKSTPAELVNLILQTAEALRRAGVVSIKLDGCEVALMPFVEPLRMVTPEALGYAAAMSPNAADDLLTHGGRPMPTLRRPGGLNGG